MIEQRALPFDIVLAADPTPEGRALFNEFLPSYAVKDNIKAMYNHIRSSGESTPLSGYLIHTHSFATSKLTADFWQLQLSVTVQLRKLRSPGIVIAG